MQPNRQLPGNIEENFRFLVMDVRKQVEETLAFLDHPAAGLMERIDSRDDYIDNMKSLIEDKAFGYITSPEGMDRASVNLMRALTTITSNLERIADFAVNVVNQTKYLADPNFLASYDYEPFFREVFAALDLIIQALQRHDMAQAFRICHSEFVLDAMYAERFQRILGELREGRHTGDLVTTLFIFRYLERMGDSLLNIGEALIFVHLGEKLKIHQYEALTGTLASSGLEQPLSEVEFESIWGSRSGCRIGTVDDKKTDGSHQRVIFKEGRRGKLLEEKENIERWHRLMPGLPPRVFGFQEQGEQASILLEFLPGCTLQEVLISADHEVWENAVFLLEEHQSIIWRETWRDEPAKAGFIKQLRARAADVYRVHPYFRDHAQAIGGLALPCFEDKLARAAEATAEVRAPFSVFIHGDYNVNNIIYDHNQQRLHFIDLHRSAQTDYIQDVSVFLVSGFRIPVKEAPFRARINRTNQRFLAFARGFASERGDALFDIRLALGLMRSLFTSTRFELDPKFAKVMYMRSAYLLDRILDHIGRPWEEFALPEGVLVY